MVRKSRSVLASSDEKPAISCNFSARNVHSIASVNHTRRRVCLYLQCAQHRCHPGRAMAAWDRAQAVDHVFVEERSGDFGE
jgi:hypothetical protein